MEHLKNEGNVDFKVKDNEGIKLFCNAVKHSNLEIAKCITEKFRTKNGYTPLHWAAENGYLDMIKYLIDEDKIDVNARDKHRYTPLHYAAKNNKLNIVKYLIDEGKADLTVKEKYGKTPLYLATENNHSDIVNYIIDKSDLNITDELIYTSMANIKIHNRRLLAEEKLDKAHGVIPVADMVIGIVDIAFGVKDILQEFGIIPDKQTEEFEKVLNAIGRNYAAIEEVGNKVDRNFAVIKAIFEMTSKTLSTIEETRVEMRQGFRRVLESINELKVGDKISSLTTFMDDFIKDVEIVKGLSPSVRVTELERSGGILDKLKSAITSDGILHGNLYHILNQGLAIPKNAGDEVAFTTLHVLYYGVQTYVSAMFFVFDQYSFLADYYHQRGDVDNCNKYFDLIQLSFKNFKGALLSTRNKKYLIDKVIDVLKEVQGLTFVRNERGDVFKLLEKRVDSLDIVIQKLQGMTLPLVADQPEVIIRKPDFSKSNVKTPIGEWKDGATVSYAIQYKDNSTYSKVGEWSDAFTVYGKANPFLPKIPVDPRRRTRLIFRKINNNQPELVGTIEDKYQINFRDISRDFYDAALSSNEGVATNEAQILLHNGADINEAFENGRRAIHAAAQRGNCEIATNFLIKDNATDINIKDIDGYTPIYIAAEAGYENFVELLVNSKADVNAKTNSDNFTPLHISAYKGDVSTVEALMKSDKLRINARDKKGFAPLHNAVFGGTYVFNTLSSSDSIDINAKSEEGLTPLHIASMNDFEDVVEVLLKNNKSDINAVANGNLTALHFAASLENTNVVKLLVAQNETDINAKSVDGWTALHFAAFLKKEDTALELLKAQNIKVNAKGKNYITPLHVATVTGQQNVTLNLLKNGALTEEKTEDGLTALHLAAMRNQCKIIPILIDNGANIEAKTFNGSTPLNIAASFGNKESVLILLDNKADTKTHDNNGQSPVHEAVLNGKTEIVRLLIERDPSLINLYNQNSESLLHLAAQKNYLDIARYLVNEKDVCVNVRNRNHDTPLHYASKYGHLDAVKYFLDNGTFDIFVSDGRYLLGNKFGETPLDFAAQAGHIEIVKHFIDDKKIAGNDYEQRNTCKPLFFAVESGDLSLVKYLIDEKKVCTRYDVSLAAKHAARLGKLNLVQYFVDEKGIGVDEKLDIHDLTLLHYASLSGSLELVKYLTDVKYAQTDARGDCVGYCYYGKYPLHYAALAGNLALVKYFVDEKKVDVNVKSSMYKETSLHFAALSGNLDLVKYLVDEKNCDINSTSVIAPSSYPVFLLQFASLSGSLDLLKYLIEEKNANIHMQFKISYFNNKPLDLAITSGNLNSVKYLIDEKNVSMDGSCNFKAREKFDPVQYGYVEDLYGEYIYPRNPSKNSYLYCAVVSGNLEMVKYLVGEKKFDVNLIEGYYLSPLHGAAEYGYLDIVKYLVNHNADANLKNRDDSTPLNYAAKFGHMDIVKYLVDERKVDVNVKDRADGTPLQSAVSNGYLDIVKYLVEKGANINVKFYGGKTLLHLAAYNGHLDVVKYVIEKGADVNAKDDYGNTPLKDAVDKNRLDVIKYLESKGARRSMGSAHVKFLYNDYYMPIFQNPFKSKIDYKIEVSNEVAASGTSKPLSYVNDFANSIVAVVKNVSRFVSSSFKPTIAGEYSQTKAVTLQSVDTNGMLLLLDIFIKRLTGQKYVSTEDHPLSFLEAESYALNITDEFEKIAEQAALKSEISMHRLNIDFIEMVKNIAEKIIGGKFYEISEIAKSHIEKACPGRQAGCDGKLSIKKFEKFITEFNKGIDRSLNQLMQNVLYIKGTTLEANGMNKHQIGLEPKNRLNDASVRRYLSQARDMRLQ